MDLSQEKLRNNWKRETQDQWKGTALFVGQNLICDSPPFSPEDRTIQHLRRCVLLTLLDDWIIPKLVILNSLETCTKMAMVYNSRPISQFNFASETFPLELYCKIPNKSPYIRNKKPDHKQGRQHCGTKMLFSSTYAETKTKFRYTKKENLKILCHFIQKIYWKYGYCTNTSIYIIRRHRKKLITDKQKLP